jgi:uncharacterized protein (DUF1697 family)
LSELNKHVALLRGVNVGGKNKLPMNGLVGLFEELGCSNVSTFIQSGNVIFEAKFAILKNLEFAAENLIAKRYHIKVPVIMRSADELRHSIRENPFAKTAADPASLALMFLKDKPSSEAKNSLDPNRSPGDLFELQNREIYLQLGNGFAKTKLTNAYFDSKLKTICTGRNWNTALKLLSLCS